MRVKENPRKSGLCRCVDHANARATRGGEGHVAPGRRQGRAAVAVPQRRPGRWGGDGSLRRVVLQYLEADFDGHLILRNPALVDEPP